MASIRIAIAVLLSAVSLRAQIPCTNPPVAPAGSGRTPAFILQPANCLPVLAASSHDKATAVAVVASRVTAPAPVRRLVMGPLGPSYLHEVATAPFNLMDSAYPIPESQSTTAPRPSARPKAVVYSNGHLLRLKIHKYTSVATLPLFISELAVGQKLYNESDSESLRSTHSALAASIGVLFAANTVTGLWDLWEARKDPSGHKKRMIHGMLMLAADVGFMATGALAPDDHEEDGISTGGARDNRSLHRNVAIGSMGIATVSYLYMLLAR